MSPWSEWLIEWIIKNGYALHSYFIGLILLPVMLYSFLRLSDNWNNKDERASESLDTNIDKLNNLSEKVEALSKELSQTLSILAYDLSKRKEIIDKQKENINSLREQEKQLQSDLDVLKNTSVESAEFFSRALKNYYGEVDKRNSQRATVYFFLGILSAIIIDIIKEIFFS